MDGSPHSMKAVEVGSQIAAALKAKLILPNVAKADKLIEAMKQFAKPASKVVRYRASRFDHKFPCTLRFVLKQVKTARGLNATDDFYLRMNVTLRTTRYSLTLPFLTSTLWSFTHAPFTFFSVFEARFTPLRTASSKLSCDEAMISVTRATDIFVSLREASNLIVPCSGLTCHAVQNKQQLHTIPLDQFTTWQLDRRQGQNL